MVDVTATDAVVEALKAKWPEQHDKPEYEVGADTETGQTIYLGVDRVGQPEKPHGLEIAQTLFGTKYLISFPRSLVVWLVAQLGAYLTDDEWRDAEAQRDDEMFERVLEREDRGQR